MGCEALLRLGSQTEDGVKNSMENYNSAKIKPRVLPTATLQGKSVCCSSLRNTLDMTLEIKQRNLDINAAEKLSILLSLVLFPVKTGKSSYCSRPAS